VKVVSFSAGTADVSRLHGDVMMMMTAQITAMRKTAVSNLNLFLTGVLYSHEGVSLSTKVLKNCLWYQKCSLVLKPHA